MFGYNNPIFDYEPYPIGIIRQTFPEQLYKKLVQNFPPTELFEFKELLGNKYSLSENSHPDKYHKFILENKEWSDFYRWIKSKEFVDLTIKMLRENHIDTGIYQTEIVQKVNILEKSKQGPENGLLNKLFESKSQKQAVSETKSTKLSTRFEFSMLKADGGYLIPHTDSPGKIITLVIALAEEGGWDKSFGGGTDVLKPKDITKNFNYLNKQVPFEETQFVKTFEYEPNQCLIFVKTFNSLHAVSPMKAPKGSAVLRKTLTINIELNGGNVLF